MDGTGRLAGSDRSLRPQVNLGAAAYGALILLRERVAACLVAVRKPVKAAKPAIQREPPPRVVAWIERHVPRRAGLAATLALLAGSGWLGIVRGGHLDDFTTALSDTRNALANSAGFRITSVVINGRKQLTQDDVLGIGGVNGRSSLLF